MDRSRLIHDSEKRFSQPPSIFIILRETFWEDVIIMGNKWSREIIQDEIHNIYDSKSSLNGNEVSNIHSNLYKAGSRYFGSWENAVNSTGLDYNSFMNNKKWDKETIISEIKLRNSLGLSLQSTIVNKEDKKLFGSVRLYFGSWENAITEAGFDYNKIREVKPIGYWTKEKVIEAIYKRIEDGVPLNRNNVLKTDGGLLTAILRYFGSYEKAMQNCGLEYDEVREDTVLMSYYGIKFEKLLGDIFKDLNRKFTKNHFNKTQPDYIFENLEWADAKLSAWTDTISQTIEKYEPFCNKLTIIYLRGNKNINKQISEKTNIMSVYKLIDSFSYEKKTYYIKLLDTLWKQANDQDSKLEKNEIEIKTSHYLGVQWRKDNQKWACAITNKTKRVHLGVFQEEDKAAQAYNDYIIDNNIDKPLNEINIL
jgi:hypothetical protein